MITCTPFKARGALRDWTAVSCALGALLLAHPASADRCDSYTHCVAAMLDYNKTRDFVAAQQAAERAYSFHPDPILLYNLGRLHQKQLRFTKAIDHCERFLASGDSSLTPERRQDVEARLAQLRAPEPTQPDFPQLLAPPPPPVRLGWRTYTGVSLGSLGLGLIGIGAAALAVDGRCTTDGRPCPERYESQGTGLGMLVPGFVMVGVGVTLSGLDLARRRQPRQPALSEPPALTLFGASTRVSPAAR